MWMEIHSVLDLAQGNLATTDSRSHMLDSHLVSGLIPKVPAKAVDLNQSKVKSVVGWIFGKGQ